MTTHAYTSTLHWTGRAQTYESYGRQHDITMSDTTMAVSADAAFRGDEVLPNPEQLVVAVAALAGAEVR